MARRKLSPIEQALRAAAEYNSKNMGKVLRPVKVCDHPVTYKYVEVEA